MFSFTELGRRKSSFVRIEHRMSQGNSRDRGDGPLAPDVVLSSRADVAKAPEWTRNKRAALEMIQIGTAKNQMGKIIRASLI